ncbi:MAG: N-formylglutamate amidohydrolase [Polymorphobacter sp.]
MTNTPPFATAPTSGFTVAGAGDAVTALVLASPHSGRAYPAAFLAQTRLSIDQLRRAEDAYVDALVGGGPARGVPLVAAHYGRAWLDLNRSADELDPAMYSDRLAPHPDQYGDRVRVGLGIVPRIAAHGLDIYSGPMALAQAQARITAVHTPYHATLARLLAAARARHGHAILLDCHSMPTPLPGRLGSAQIVLGDGFGRSAAPALMAWLQAYFGDNGLRVAVNDPYAGGYTTIAHGQPQNHIHAVQIEIDRALYMDPARLRQHGGFARIAALMTGLIAQLAHDAATLALGQPQPLAAE